MATKLGGLIKSARANAGLTQAQLAALVDGASQSDIGRFERGEAVPTTQVVKNIAKACGVTQKSLLDAMPKTSTSRPSSSTSSSSTSTGTSMRLTATEKRLVELYRAANADTKKKALKVLRGEGSDMDDILAGLGGLIGDAILKK